MINEEMTKEKFGYSSTDLSSGSKKSVCVVCDYCGVSFTKPYKQRIKSNEIVDKDSCVKCKFIKRADICEAQHGVRNHAQKPEIRKILKEKTSFNDVEKMKEGMIKKYGVDHPSKCKEIVDAKNKTLIEKYGTVHISQNPDIKEKAKASNLDRYGSEYFLGSKEGRKRSEEGMLEKYGVKNAFQIPEVIEKIKEITPFKPGTKESKERSKKSVEAKIKSGQIKTYKGNRVCQWAEERGYSKSRFHVLVKQHGFEKAVKMTPYVSSLEQTLSFWFDENGINYKKGQRVKNYCPDFILDNNIIIETDGLYWHSELCQEDDNYHFNKKEEYNKEGYSSYFFREDEIRDKPEIVKSIILNALNRSNKIFARKTKVVKVSKSLASSFLQKNHLMGNGKGECFGLEHNGELVSLIRINRTSEGCYDVSRFCHKLNTNVIGGFSKLLKFVEKEIKMNTLSTFIDRRYGKGFYLHEFGFQPTSLYKSFRWTNGEESFHRLKFSNQSGYESGLVKIWDCGQHKFIKKY